MGLIFFFYGEEKGDKENNRKVDTINRAYQTYDSL